MRRESACRLSRGAGPPRAQHLQVDGGGRATRHLERQRVTRDESTVLGELCGHRGSRLIRRRGGAGDPGDGAHHQEPTGRGPSLGSAEARRLQWWAGHGAGAAARHVPPAPHPDAERNRRRLESSSDEGSAARARVIGHRTGGGDLVESLTRLNNSPSRRSGASGRGPLGSVGVRGHLRHPRRARELTR